MGKNHNTQTGQLTYSGWGRYPKQEASLVEPSSRDEFATCLAMSDPRAQKTIARGAGRSYGDSALSEILLSTRYLDNFSSLETSESGHSTLRCAAGLSLAQILETIVPKGLFLPVLPGAKAVTVGGAIASDIHGKNHHIDGSFCDHVDSLRLLLASGEVVDCSRSHHSELFHATCGGIGLTGIVLDASICLTPLSSLAITQSSLIASNLEECMELMEQHLKAKYSVAWIDCLAKGAAKGRSVLYLGEHLPASENNAQSKPQALKRSSEINIPFNAPSMLLNRYSMAAFNSSYYALKKSLPATAKIDYDKFFFPLERLRNWNRLYGAKGFLQYQLVLPLATAREGLHAILERVARAGKGSFLSVLKRFGKGNSNLLSFPIEGYTLAMDFKVEDSLFPLLDELDALVLAHGGRLYLTKDARMSAEFFRQTYPEWERFAELKAKCDPDQKFSSLQSRRLGLTR